MTDLSATIKRLRELMADRDKAYAEYREGDRQDVGIRDAAWLANNRFSYAAAEALPDLLRALEARGEPEAWVIPGDDTATVDGSIAAKVSKEGEFTKPLYAHPAAPDTVREPVATSFPERDTTKPAEQQGVFRKFIVQRVDGSDQPGGKHHGCEYFVLDMQHDPHAPAALRAYAQSCEQTHPQLSRDLLERFPPAPPDTARVPVEPTEEVISLNRECDRLNDRCIAQQKLIDDLAAMCRRLSYVVKREGRDALAAQCVQLLKKHGLGGSVVRAAAAPKEGK